MNFLHRVLSFNNSISGCVLDLTLHKKKKKQKNYGMERSLCVKLKDWMSKSVDQDETAHYEPSHLDLCCL